MIRNGEQMNGEILIGYLSPFTKFGYDCCIRLRMSEDSGMLRGQPRVVASARLCTCTTTIYYRLKWYSAPQFNHGRRFEDDFTIYDSEACRHSGLCWSVKMPRLKIVKKVEGVKLSLSELCNHDDICTDVLVDKVSPSEPR